MKIKRIVVVSLLSRFIAALCFSIGVIVWYWQTPPDSVPASFLVQLPSAPETIIQNRNLSEYDYGGTFRLCFTPVKECEALENRARDFILKQWQHKKRAYIIVEYRGADVEGEKHLFIEPNKNGQWEIVLREDVGASNFRMKGFGTNISVKTACFIKIQRATKDDYPYELCTSFLIFLDKEGEEIAYL